MIKIPLKRRVIIAASYVACIISAASSVAHKTQLRAVCSTSGRSRAGWCSLSRKDFPQAESPQLEAEVKNTHPNAGVEMPRGTAKGPRPIQEAH